MFEVQNILKDLPVPFPNEVFEDILKNDKLRIERIISQGQVSPSEGWYDQDENEWVLVLEGHAKILFDNEVVHDLQAMDYLYIPAHQKHKVLWSDPNQRTVWLAIFFS